LSKITQTLQALKSVAEMQKLPAPKDGDDLPGKLRIPEAKRSHPAAMRTA
jgi:hypothetical protein